MTREEIKARIEAIEDEMNYLDDMQYRLGYIVDRQYQAKMYHEKVELKKALEEVENHD